MKCTRIIERYTPGQKLRIIPLGDLHLGNKLCSKKHIREVVAKYKGDKDARFVLMGDLFDGIFVGDKRYQASMIDPYHAVEDAPIDKAIEEAVEIFDPVKDRIWAVLEGNHEDTVKKRGGTDMIHRFLWGLYASCPDGAKKVEAVRYGYSGFLTVAFQRDKVNTSFSIVSFLCHGVTGGGKSEGGFMSSIGNNAKSYRADIQIYGHNHKLMGWDNMVIMPNKNGNKLTSLREVRINSGTFLKGFSDDHNVSYSEKAQYKPNELGYMVIELDLKSDDYHMRYWKESVDSST